MVHRIQRGILVPVALLLLVDLAPAAQRDIIETDWAGFERQVETRKLPGRTVEIRFTDGVRNKTKAMALIGRLVGYLIGRAVDKSAPEFVVTHQWQN